MTNIPISISDKAKIEIQNIRSNKNIPPEYGLRVGIKGAGCSGVSFMLGFDTKKDNDNQFHLEDLNILISKPHMMYLFGKSIDFYDEADAKGFVFVDTEEIKN